MSKDNYKATSSLCAINHSRFSRVKQLAVVLALFLLVVFIVTKSSETPKPPAKNVNQPSSSDNNAYDPSCPCASGKMDYDITSLDFVPGRGQSLADCDDLFVKTEAASFNMSSDYWSKFNSFQEAVKQSRATMTTKGEGHSEQLPTMYRVLHFLASRQDIRQVCETGFNMGHSAFNFLTASQQTRIQSFDLGKHSYTSPMISHLKSVFPDRLSVELGDSTVTIPKFIRANADFRCDLIYVDGGHTYDVAVADLLNLASIARGTQTLVVFDDYPSRMFSVSMGVAWEDVRRWGYLNELMRCSFQSTKNMRGFVIGQVAERPTIDNQGH